MMTKTVLEDRHGHQVERVGTSGLTVTAVREGQEVEVLIEFDVASPEECSSMIAMLLAQLDDLHGERFVARCLAHYAEETGKVFMDKGDHKVVMIRGRRRR